MGRWLRLVLRPLKMKMSIELNCAPAPPPGGSERIRVRAAAASSRAHETDEVRRFRTCVPTERQRDGKLV